MANGVFIHREDSIYRDTPEIRYHFPRQYLKAASRCIGDWIVYYEPTKVPGSRGYWAIARVQEIVPDPDAGHMYYAMISPGEFIEFTNRVPIKVSGRYVEQGMLNARGTPSGRGQSAVRDLSVEDFVRIVNLGLPEEDELLPRIDPPSTELVRDTRMAFGFDQIERPRILSSRAQRDHAFRRTVINAYDSRCAFTGLKLINGGGRAEVEAAHIQPVARGGPDSISNGMALSGTVHWMFDRGLITVEDDLTIRVSRQVNDAGSVHSLLNRSGKAIIPADPRDAPHPLFLRWHREHCFKQ